MTTTEDSAVPSRVGLALTGIQHVGLTVADVETSAAWYERVLGLGRQFTEPHHQSDLGAPLGRAGHVGHVPQHRLGSSPEPSGRALRPDAYRAGPPVPAVGVARGTSRLGRPPRSEGVEHSGVYPMPGMPISLLTFRDPDGIQLELIAFHPAD